MSGKAEGSGVGPEAAEVALAVAAVVELKRAEARCGKGWTAGRRREFNGDIEPAPSGDLAGRAVKDESYKQVNNADSLMLDDTPSDTHRSLPTNRESHSVPGCCCCSISGPS